MPPVLDFVIHLRQFLETDRPMLSNFITDAKTFTDAGKAVFADGSDILAKIQSLGLFGSPPMTTNPASLCEGECESTTGSTLIQSILIERVKRLAEKQVRTEGYSPTPDNPITVPNPAFSIDAVWPKAVAAGADQVVIEQLSESAGYSDVVGAGGKIIARIKTAIAWIVAHAPQELAAVEALLSLLSLLGVL